MSTLEQGDLGEKRVDDVDVTLFEPVLSQTCPGDRRSLLAVQRAIAQHYRAYSYLEIGSFMGGTLQPHLVDPRCTQIYSIDPRVDSAPADRAVGSHFNYANNSSESMLRGLEQGGFGDTAKVQCIEKDASEVNDAELIVAPLISFIDGEHTVAAVLSDYTFCKRVSNPKGVILFHDFGLIHPAISQICRELKQGGHPAIALKLEGHVFGIFLDPAVVHQDEYLSKWYGKNKNFLEKWRVRMWLKSNLPKALFEAIRGTRKSWWS